MEIPKVVVLRYHRQTDPVPLIDLMHDGMHLAGWLLSFYADTNVSLTFERYTRLPMMANGSVDAVTTVAY